MVLPYKDILHDAWARYLPPSPAKSTTSATRETCIEYQAVNVADGLADAANVADADAAVADDAADFTQETVKIINNMSDVADVAHLAGDACEQCGGQGDRLRHYGDVLLHPECRQYRLRTGR